MGFRKDSFLYVAVIVITWFLLTGCSQNGLNQDYKLNISVQGSGSVLRDPARTAYSKGETVKLTARPDPGWDFVGWSGGGFDGSSTHPLVITVDGDYNIKAIFQGEPEIKSAGDNRQIVFSNGAVLANVNSGDMVTMQEIAAPLSSNTDLTIAGKVIDFDYNGTVPESGVDIRLPVDNEADNYTRLYYYNQETASWELVANSELVLGEQSYVQGTVFHFSTYAALSSGKGVYPDYLYLTIYEFPRFLANYKVIARDPLDGSEVDISPPGTTTVSVIDNYVDNDPRSNPTGVGRTFYLGEDIPIKTTVRREVADEFTYTPMAELMVTADTPVNYRIEDIVTELRKPNGGDWQLIHSNQVNWSNDYMSSWLEYEGDPIYHWAELTQGLINNNTWKTLNDNGERILLTDYTFSMEVYLDSSKIQGDAGRNAAVGVNLRSQVIGQDHYRVLWSQEGLFLYTASGSGDNKYLVKRDGTNPITPDSWHKIEVTANGNQLSIMTDDDEDKMLEVDLTDKPELQCPEGGYGPLFYRTGGYIRNFSGTYQKSGRVSGVSRTAAVKASDSFQQISKVTYGELMSSQVESWLAESGYPAIDSIRYYATGNNSNIEIEQPENKDDYIRARSKEAMYKDILCDFEVKNLSGKNADIIDMYINKNSLTLNISTEARYIYSKTEKLAAGQLEIPLEDSHFPADSYTLASDDNYVKQKRVGYPARTTFAVISGQNGKLSWKYGTTDKTEIPGMNGNSLITTHHKINGGKENDIILVDFE